GLSLQEIDVGFRFRLIVPASVSTVPVAWIVRPAVQFRGLCAFLFPRTPPTTVLIRHGRALSGFKCIRLAFPSAMMAVSVTLSPGGTKERRRQLRECWHWRLPT